jgi:hypothetical protein
MPSSTDILKYTRVQTESNRFGCNRRLSRYGTKFSTTTVYCVLLYYRCCTWRTRDNHGTKFSTVPLGRSKLFYKLGSYLKYNYRYVLHFCMCNFVWEDNANWALSAQTKFHIQKYDGLENKENPSRAFEETSF